MLCFVYAIILKAHLFETVWSNFKCYFLIRHLQPILINFMNYFHYLIKNHLAALNFYQQTKFNFTILNQFNQQSPHFDLQKSTIAFTNF
jgi:hypothetical protein